MSENPDYDALPECIKAEYTEKEYIWLPEPLKRTIIEDSTMPEDPEDD